MAAPPAKRRKGAPEETIGGDVVQTTNVYAVPTREELATLRETETLFRSNIFRMQLDAMLSETKLIYGVHSDTEASLQTLKDVLDAASAGPECMVNCRDTVTGGVLPPLSVGAELDDVRFQFLPPVDVHVVGSFLLRTGINLEPNVDVGVLMPAETFQSKDHLNHRYFLKRNLYLAHLAAVVRKSAVFAEVIYSWAQGDALRPMLVVRPKRPSGKPAKVTLRIYPLLAPGVFNMTKLLPDCNNVRWAKCQTLLPPGAHRPREEESATPHTNNAILFDIYPRLHLELMHSFLTQTSCPGFVDGLALLKIWLHQRGFTGNVLGTFNGFVATMLVFHLFQTRLLSKESSSYQIFKVALAQIARAEWTTKGLFMSHHSMHPDFPAPVYRPSQETFHSNFEVVFVEPSGFCNLLGQMNKAAFMHLQHQAQATLRLLDTERGGNPRVLPQVYFDVIIRVRVTPRVAQQYGPQLLDRGNWVDFANHFVLTVLSQGLNDRIQLLAPIRSEAPSWPVGEHSPLYGASEAVVLVGLVIAPETFKRVVDVGPPSDSARSASFRNFWGPKAELRRFPDGAIVESVVWSRQAPETHLILEDIAVFVLNRHGGVQPSDIAMSHDLYGGLLSLPEEGNIGQQHMQSVNHIFERFSRELRALDDSPLFITSLQGVSPSFRYTAVFPPPALGTSYYEPLDVVLQFENSGHWPDDVAAIQSVKSAFYIRLASIIKEQLKYETTVVETFLDVAVAGLVFRLHIFVDRELFLLKRETENLESAVVTARDSGVAQPDLLVQAQAARAATTHLEHFCVHLPEHTAMCHALHLSYPLFCDVTRLAHRWVAAHMLSDVVGVAAVDLLVASLFLTPGTVAPPGSSTVGLLRFVLLLGQHDWLGEPLIIDTAGSMTALDHADITTRFRKNRQLLPAMFIATNGDRDSSRWTSAMPSKQLLVRLVSLAQASARTILDQLQNVARIGEFPDERVVFRTPTRDYPVLVHLKPSRLPYAICSVDPPAQVPEKLSVFKNLATKSPFSGEHGKPAVGFDPAELFLKDLRSHFGHAALFFGDPLGGCTIGIVWKPTAPRAQVTTPHPFKVAFSKDVMPVAPKQAKVDQKKKRKSAATKEDEPVPEQNQVVLNRLAVLEAIRVLGHGLIDRIQVQSE